MRLALGWLVLKKAFMRQYWRIQQSQTLISMGFWITTLTLLMWPYVSWRFESETEMLAVPMTYWGLGAIASVSYTHLTLPTKRIV